MTPYTVARTRRITPDRRYPSRYTHNIRSNHSLWTHFLTRNDSSVAPEIFNENTTCVTEISHSNASFYQLSTYSSGHVCNSRRTTQRTSWPWEDTPVSIAFHLSVTSVATYTRNDYNARRSTRTKCHVIALPVDCQNWTTCVLLCLRIVAEPSPLYR